MYWLDWKMFGIKATNFNPDINISVLAFESFRALEAILPETVMNKFEFKHSNDRIKGFAHF